MSPSEWMLVALRVVHNFASVVWLGGGVYFLVALRPAAREADTAGKAVAAAAQKAFGEWGQLATIALVGTGAVLMFERLSDGRGGWVYAGLLALKILSALVAFLLVRSMVRSRKGRHRRTAELVLGLGLIAFIVGIVLASLWGSGFLT